MSVQVNEAPTPIESIVVESASGQGRHMVIRPTEPNGSKVAFVINNKDGEEMAAIRISKEDFLELIEAMDDNSAFLAQ